MEKQKPVRQQATHDLLHMPIRYHKAVKQQFDAWAQACGSTPNTLRIASEQAIRSRHHEARIEHESHKAHGKQPDIFTLSLGMNLAGVDVIYTIEHDTVMIRGYGWQIDHEPLDPFDGGGSYSERKWDLW